MLNAQEQFFDGFLQNLHFLGSHEWYARRQTARPARPRFGGVERRPQALAPDLDAVRKNVLAYALHLTRNNYEQAQDLVQEAILRYLGARENLRNPEKVGAYVAAIVRNLHLAEVAVQDRIAGGLTEVEALPSRADPVAEVLERLDWEACIDALLELHARDPQAARLVLQHAYEGIRLQELAQQSGITPGGMRAKYHRLLLRLRVRVAHLLGGEVRYGTEG